MLAFSIRGRGGARAAKKLSFLAIGKDALLRLMRRRSVGISRAENSSVKILGVEDFAFRKGINYGTILVDLKRRQPIDLLPDREAKPLTEWLRRNPQLELVTRHERWILQLHSENLNNSQIKRELKKRFSFDIGIWSIRETLRK